MTPGKVTVADRTIAGDRWIRVLLDEKFDLLKISNSTMAPEVYARKNGNQIRLQKIVGGGQSDLGIDSGFRFEPASGMILELNGNPYRGKIDVFINPLGVAVAVNEVEIESYLRSVVPKELGPEKYPEIEALKAQAVAARTFALDRIGANAVHGFDVFKDVRSQVYEGVMVEHTLSDSAVLATRGEIASFEGSPISCMYSSTCGGRTEDYHELFNGPPIKYLSGGVSCPDEKSPYHKWKERIPVGVIQRNLEQIKSVGRIKKIATVEYSRNQRLKKARFLGDSGDITLVGYDIRTALGVRSNYITRLELEKNSEGFVEYVEVEGRGWGHGVGLCQTGAVELASRRWEYQKILKYYYQGIQLTKAY
jgi:stage II sporulation protein D